MTGPRDPSAHAKLATRLARRASRHPLAAAGIVLAIVLAVSVFGLAGRPGPAQREPRAREPRAEKRDADRDIAALEAAIAAEADPARLPALLARLDDAVGRAEQASALLEGDAAAPPGDALDAELHRVLAHLDADSYAIPPSFSARVRELVARFEREGERDQRGRDAQAAVWPIITAELAALGLPEELAYLAGIESHWDAQARSPAGAVGLWQLVRSTAVSYGLRVDDTVDERTDARKSSHAAAQHLADLLAELGGDDAALYAVLAYNQGANRTRARLVELARAPDGWRRGRRAFFRLQRLRQLPPEAMIVLPRLLAAAIVDQRRGTRGK